MASAAKKKSGVIVPQPLHWRRKLAAALIFQVMRICIKSWRSRWQNAFVHVPGSGPVIFCVWHNRLALAIASYKFTRTNWPGDGLAAMISASRDGGLIANVVERFGLQPIRGSSSRRGPQALLEATSWVKKNYNIAITPDGPRGPRYKIQMGIIDLARITGCPIIPTSHDAHWKIRLRSWDRFQIPLPFSRCELRFGLPIHVPRDASDAERERLRQHLEHAMLAITTE